MQGNDSFYVVQKAFKFTPNKEQIVRWVEYLKAVRVCDFASRRSRLPAEQKLKRDVASSPAR